MKLVNEYIDEKDNKYVMTFEGTQEEINTLNEICENEKITLDELIEKAVTDFIAEPIESIKRIIAKNEPGKIGEPKYKIGDTVGFVLNFDGSEKFFQGKVEIVDAYGVFEQKKEPSYDILVENFNNSGEPCLCKHIQESECLIIKELEEER